MNNYSYSDLEHVVKLLPRGKIPGVHSRSGVHSNSALSRLSVIFWPTAPTLSGVRVVAQTFIAMG